MAPDPSSLGSGASGVASGKDVGTQKRSVLATELVVLVLAVVIPAVVIGLNKGFSHDEPTPGAGPAILGLVIAAPLVLLRRRWPIPLLVVSVAASATLIAVTGDRTPMLIAVVILLYTVASTNERRVGFVAGALTALVLYVTLALGVDGAALGPDSLAAIAWSLLAVAAGDAVRTRRAYVAAIEERARRAEETRDEEARRRVVEERLRIARELHDVVAHRMAVINVQAAAASQLLASDPARAAESLEHVRSSAAEVLQELGGMLHVLRADDGDPGAAPVQPMPAVRDLAELEALAASFAPAGLVVTTRIPPDAALPEAVGVVVYRVVQESLTNAQRHGAGTATVTSTWDERQLHLTITNPIGAAAAPGAGLGLVGMRERVEAVGGRLQAGPAGDAWVVEASIPLAIGAPRG